VISSWRLLAWSSLAGIPVILAAALLHGEPLWPHVWWPVAALGLAGNVHGVTTLRRLARDGDGVVGYAADRMLEAEGRRAG